MHLEPAATGSAGASWSFAKALSLAVLALCEVLAMSLWFSASPVVPVLKAEYGIGDGQAATLSSSVALGFVVGTLLSAIFGLADRLDPRAFFTASALVGAAANGAAVLIAPTSFGFVVLCFIVGATIAGEGAVLGQARRVRDHRLRRDRVSRRVLRHHRSCAAAGLRVRDG